MTTACHFVVDILTRNAFRSRFLISRKWFSSLWSLLLFSFHHLITARLSNMVKSFLISRRVNPELLRLGNEIRRLKAQLATISPTSEFSAYFKTERVLKKAGEEYEAAVAEERREGPSEVKVEIIVKIALQAVGLVLLHCVSGIYVRFAFVHPI
ncbi:hypothetical protein KIN20_018644 [Parelaphostrongylus tenuis]|uniref:Uncharacterized protein n=1 Tax=Parelaphostrongylus tenuis TaxID=148309 RepID=A0AAD5QUH1_PARTN|nr:hypothetical protein KIN20_018644 [Parelaphostrongylus tenuis]